MMTFYKHRSPALKKFWMNLKEVGVLMSLITSNKNSNASRQREVSESLCRSIVLLLCSHMENFFDAFVHRRNSITHGNLSNRPTINNVKKFIIDTCEIVRFFNEMVSEYLIKDFGVVDPWQLSTAGVADV